MFLRGLGETSRRWMGELREPPDGESEKWYLSELAPALLIQRRSLLRVFIREARERRNFSRQLRTIDSTMNSSSTDLRELQGRVVLVTSALDAHNPPAGLRGTLDVQTLGAGQKPSVRVILDFPDMFTSPAHTRIIPLDDAALVQLLASERSGAYELVLQDKLD